MPTLELVLDANGMQRGAQQAEASLKSVQTAASSTATSVQATSRALSNTFQVTQGGVQIATGIAQTAQAFQSLNTAAAGFAASRTVLEIGQTATQLAALRAGAGAASSAFLLLGRAIPYVGLALSAGSALYAIFGNSVSETTKKVNDQVDALSRLQSKISETEIRAGYGQADPRTSQGGIIDTLTALRQSEQKQFSTYEAARLFGLSEQEFRYSAARGGLGEAALEYVPGRYGLIDPRTGRPFYSGNALFQMQSFTREQVIGAGEDILGQRRGLQPGTLQANGAYEVDQARRMSRSFAGAERANTEAVQQRQQEQARAVEESMARAAAYAGQIGSALGAGVYDVLAGIQGWRQALASIISSVARGGLSNLGSSLASSLFNPTKAQSGGSMVGPGNYVEIQ